MPEIFLHKRRIKSIFQLLGDHENDMTYSTAWVLANSPAFLGQFLEATVGINPDLDSVTIRLQQREKRAGVTDIEIESPGLFNLIIEAKRGWDVPTLKQLATYAARKSFQVTGGAVRRIVPLSACSREFTLSRLGRTEIAGAVICPLSWKEVSGLATNAQRRASHAEKRLLRELLTYLEGIMKLQNSDSNWVYVVSLGAGTPGGWGISWIDIVKKRRAYFHPVGLRGWPKVPVNYIGFRYSGMLQSIHHVEDAEVCTNPNARFPEIPAQDWGPHFLYKLGPAFAPAHEVRMGKLYPNGRNWCMLDTLFTCDTISDARDLSDKRAAAQAG